MICITRSSVTHTVTHICRQEPGSQMCQPSSFYLPPCHSVRCIKEHVETQRDQMLECSTMRTIKSIPAGTKGGPVAV